MLLGTPRLRDRLVRLVIQDYIYGIRLIRSEESRQDVATVHMKSV